MCPLEGVREAFISGPRTRKNCESALFLSCGRCGSSLLWPSGSSAQSQSFVLALMWPVLRVLTQPPPSRPFSFLIAWISLLALHCDLCFSKPVVLYLGPILCQNHLGSCCFFFLNASARAPLPCFNCSERVPEPKYVSRAPQRFTCVGWEPAHFTPFHSCLPNKAGINRQKGWSLGGQPPQSRVVSA